MSCFQRVYEHGWRTSWLSWTGAALRCSFIYIYLCTLCRHILCVYIHTCMCTHILTFLLMYASTDTIYIYYMCMYLCMYVCMHVYIHKHLGSTMPAWRAGACALGTLGVGVVFWFVFWGATQQDTCDFEASFSCVRSGM